MNYTDNVAKTWENATPVEDKTPKAMVCNRRLAKRVIREIQKDFKTNRGEDLMIRVYSIHESFLYRWFGNKSYWMVTRSQAFNLKSRLEDFLERKESSVITLSFTQARYPFLYLKESRNAN